MAQAWSGREGRPEVVPRVGMDSKSQIPQSLKDAHDLLEVRLTGWPGPLGSPRDHWVIRLARLPDPQPYMLP